MKKLGCFLLAVLCATGGASAETLRDVRDKYGDYKTIAVVNQTATKQYMRSAFSLDTMQNQIRRAWRQGYDVKRIKYGNGRWIAVFEKASKQTRQTYVVAPRWKAVDATLRDFWKKGYDATHIEYGLGKWIVLFAKGTGYRHQAYERHKKRDAFVQAVKRRWKEGYDVIDIEYGEGRFTGLFAKPTDAKDQALLTRDYWYDTMRAINAYWQKGYRVSNVEYMLGRWTVVLSRYPQTTVQRIETAPSADALIKRVCTKAKEGFGVVDLAEGW